MNSINFTEIPVSKLKSEIVTEILQAIEELEV